ncbi:MAG: hypothetical protein AABX10_03050 [Nanoarchaeota archaeon]
MHIRNLENMLLISLKNKDLSKVKKLVKDMSLNGEYVEIRDCLEEHNDDDLFSIISEENEHIIIILGIKKIHLILPKIGKFEELKDNIVDLFDKK